MAGTLGGGSQSSRVGLTAVMRLARSLPEPPHKPRQAEGDGKNNYGSQGEPRGVPQSPPHPAGAVRHSLPPGKNQSACWMSGSMMPTICSETVVIISVTFLQGSGSATPPQPGLIPGGVLTPDPAPSPSPASLRHARFAPGSLTHPPAARGGWAPARWPRCSASFYSCPGTRSAWPGI